MSAAFRVPCVEDRPGFLVPGWSRSDGLGAAPVCLSPWRRAGLDVAELIVSAGRVGPDDVFVDLGSGDGSVVLDVVGRTGCVGVGIEAASDLVALSVRSAGRLSAGRAIFLHELIGSRGLSGGHRSVLLASSVRRRGRAGVDRRCENRPGSQIGDPAGAPGRRPGPENRPRKLNWGPGRRPGSPKRAAEAKSGTWPPPRGAGWVPRTGPEAKIGDLAGAPGRSSVVRPSSWVRPFGPCVSGSSCLYLLHPRVRGVARRRFLPWFPWWGLPPLLRGLRGIHWSRVLCQMVFQRPAPRIRSMVSASGHASPPSTACPRNARSSIASGAYPVCSTHTLM